MFARAWENHLNEPFFIFKCRQQPVLLSHHLCDSDIQSWLSLNDTNIDLKREDFNIGCKDKVNGDRRITLRIRFYHMIVFSSTFLYILKMSKNALHNSVYFRRTGTPAVCPKLTSAALTKLTNDVDVIFHLEPGNVCYHMLVKHVKLVLRVNIFNWNLQYQSYTYCPVSYAKNI